MSKEQLRQSIIRRLQRMKREQHQILVDKEYWNEVRTDAAPFDVGWDRLMLKCIGENLDAWERGDIAEANRLNQEMQDLADAAESAP